MDLDNNNLLNRKLAMEVLEEALVQVSRLQTKLVQLQVAWEAREEDLGHRLKASSRTQLLLQVESWEALAPQVVSLVASGSQVESQADLELQVVSQVALEHLVEDLMPLQVWEVASVHLTQQLLRSQLSHHRFCPR